MLKQKQRSTAFGNIRATHFGSQEQLVPPLQIRNVKELVLANHHLARIEDDADEVGRVGCEEAEGGAKWMRHHVSRPCSVHVRAASRHTHVLLEEPAPLRWHEFATLHRLPDLEQVSGEGDGRAVRHYREGRVGRSDPLPQPHTAPHL